MGVKELIGKKRRGGKLSAGEIHFLIDGYTAGGIPDYQMSAFTMAVCLQGMDDEELFALTLAMVESGRVLNLDDMPGVKVDKHSTGGVGDTTTLVLAPLVAAAGIPVPKMSGRGLGHTGGTIDKLESIPGFRTTLSVDEFTGSVRRVGVAVAGQTEDLVPADRKLYALRDATATADSLPLIASSIMSKKIAGGADALVLDVKAGDGALLESEDEAFELAASMVNIGVRAGIDTIALVTDMSQPLGRAVGNALEVAEAIACLGGKGPPDLWNLVSSLGAHMLVMGKAAGSAADGARKLRRLLNCGAGLQKLGQLISNQGGDPGIIEDRSLLPRAQERRAVTSQRKGFIRRIRTRQIGKAAAALGAGRKVKDTPVDPAAGLLIERKVGDPVSPGDTLATLHIGESGAQLPAIRDLVRESFELTEETCAAPGLLRGLVGGDGITRYQRCGGTRR